MVSSSAGALPGSKIKTGLVSKSEFLRVSELFLNCGLNFTKKVAKKVTKKIKKYWTSRGLSCILNSGHFGEVPKLAEGAPLERE